MPQVLLEELGCRMGMFVGVCGISMPKFMISFCYYVYLFVAQTLHIIIICIHQSSICIIEASVTLLGWLL